MPYSDLLAFTKEFSLKKQVLNQNLQLSHELSTGKVIANHKTFLC